MLGRSRFDSLTTAMRLAVDSLRAHKLRSFLTLLGVIIGVASVVLVGAAIEGLGTYAETSTSKAFGTDSYLIAQIASAGRLSRKELSDKLRRNKRIRQEDLVYLRSVTGDQVLYSTFRQRSDDLKLNELAFENAVIIGASAALPEIRDVTVVEGRFFTESEEQSKQAVCVIGDDVKLAFFPGGSALSQVIKLNGLDFTVIGVQEKLGSAFGRSQDNSMYIPATTFNRMFGPGQTLSIFGRARPGTNLQLDDALDITRAALRTRFKARPGQPDNFDTLTPDSIRGFVTNILGLISAVIVPVTSISLVVGGIVIMNIMLVSVTERTREIGIRKAIGARPWDLKLQFLIEAVLMAAIGGLIGLLVGIALTAILSRAFEVPLTVTPPYVIVALVVSSTVGIISGWYPATRAAKLDPVEALRAE